MRVSSKVLLVDGADRLLLLRCTDPARPGLQWLELPGGGVEQGEDAVDAAVRELREETGYGLTRGDLGPLQWTQVAAFSWRGADHVARHEGRLARLPGRLAPQPPELTAAEQGTVLDQRWWSAAELSAHPGRTFPRNLRTLLPRLLAGERVDERDDDWERGWPEAPLRRRAARVLLLDGQERVLLFRGNDPADPGRQGWWFTPGGGLDPGEDVRAAAVRELREETGLHVQPDALVGPVHRRSTSFAFDGVTYAQQEQYFLYRVAGPEVDTAGFTPLERASVSGHRWFSREQLAAEPLTAYPLELPEVLARAAGGSWC